MASYRLGGTFLVQILLILTDKFTCQSTATDKPTRGARTRGATDSAQEGR